MRPRSDSSLPFPLKFLVRRSKSMNLWMIPISPCDPNVMLFHPLVSKIWAETDQIGTLFDNNWPPSWMRHSDWTDCWTRVSPNRKEAISSISVQFYHMAERYERVRFGWHCAKGHAELKIEKPRVKTSSYHFPKLYHSNPNSFSANVHLRQMYFFKRLNS